MMRTLADVAIEMVENNEPWCARQYYLPDYERYVFLNYTVFGSIRFCVTEPIGGYVTLDNYGNVIEWCFGQKNVTMKVIQSFAAIINALERGTFNSLPTSSRIKPIERDQQFLHAVLALTGVQLIEYEPDEP